MNLLFVIDSIDQPDAATPTLLRRICAQFAADGNAVTLLELATDGMILPASPAGVQREIVYCNGETLLHSIVRDGKDRGESLLPILCKLMLHPSAVGAAWQLLVLKNGPRGKCCQENIENLCAKSQYDAVLTASAPHHTAFALLRARISADTLKAPVLFDPYSTGPFYRSKRDVRLEERLLRECAVTFVAKDVLQGYATSSLCVFCKKVKCIDFPALIAHDISSDISVASPFIDCVFIGTLYQNLRSPQAVLELFCQNNDPRMRLVFIGDSHRFSAEFFAPYQKILKERLVLQGPIPYQKAISAMEHAAFLINIGNANSTQIPSKLFDYFSTGRPVINFCKNDQDTSFPLVAQYQSGLNLLEDTAMSDKIKALRQFCLTKQEVQIPFSVVASTFPSYTPAAVSKTIAQTLQALQ